MDTKKNKSEKKKKSKIVESDFTAEITDGVVLDIYCADDDYKDSVKLTFNNCFVVYGKVIETEESYFISLPSYFTGKGRKKKWHNLAYFFDKNVLNTIEDLLCDFYEKGE